MHEEYGGVVPELASRDHIRRAIPLLDKVFTDSGVAHDEIDAIAYTQGPGLAGALLVGASVACGLGLALDNPMLGIHHLEGHLLRSEERRGGTEGVRPCESGWSPYTSKKKI